MTAETAPAVVVAGDALVDLTPAMTVSGAAAYEPHPGGSCLNVAVGLGRLEVPTGFLARVSTDAFGRLIRAHLAASDVQPSYLVDTDDLTTLAAVHLREGHATYSFHAADAADRGLLPDHLPTLPPDSALHLGSIALVLEPIASTLEGLMRSEGGSRVISLDPNVRPSLIPDREEYLRRFAGWVSLVDVLKVSTEDLAWLYPDRAANDVVAGWHCRRGVSRPGDRGRCGGQRQYAVGRGPCRRPAGPGGGYRRCRGCVHGRRACPPPRAPTAQ